MARAREFDPDDALNRAMEVFWQKGYASTSIEDLVGATGVSRYGLYGEFESKRGLFLACLDHYQDTVVEMAFGVVEGEQASLNEVRAYFFRLLELSLTEQGKLGCMMANTASDVAPYDKRAANKVEKFRTRMQGGFRNALKRAKSNGEVPGKVDVDQAADFLTGVAQGLSVMSRSHADPKMMSNVVTTALGCLE